MRVNIYKEEMTNQLTIVTKTVNGIDYVGVRFFLHPPVTMGSPENGATMRGPFIQKDGDDDTSAVTFWMTDNNSGIFDMAAELLDQFFINRNGGSLIERLTYAVPFKNNAEIVMSRKGLEECAKRLGLEVVEKGNQS